MIGAMSWDRWMFVVCIGFFGCAKTHPIASHRFVPSCEGMCEYYTACAGHDPDADEARACLSDCRLLYTDNGNTNERMLWQLQQLECPELLAYIEG